MTLILSSGGTAATPLFLVARYVLLLAVTSEAVEALPPFFPQGSPESPH